MSDPVVPKEYTAGLSIGSNGGGSRGVLGCYAKYTGPEINIAGGDDKPIKLKTNDAVLLTSSHIMFPGFQVAPKIGAYTPGYSSCCGTRIGTPVVDLDDKAKSNPLKWDQDSVTKGQNYTAGFLTDHATIQIPAPNEKGYMNQSNQLCSHTDSALAKLDPGIKFNNVLRTSLGDTAITGSIDLLKNVSGLSRTSPGSTPPKSEYVRVYTPRLDQFIHGTLLWCTTDSFLDSILINEGTPKERRISPIFAFGISNRAPDQDKAIGALPNNQQFLILPRPPRGDDPDYTTDYKNAYVPLSFEDGDAGAVVIDSNGMVIGQIARMQEFKIAQFVSDADANNIEFQKAGNLGVASPIRDVLKQMQIEIPNIPAGFASTVPSDGRPRLLLPGDAEMEARRRAMQRLSSGLRRSRRGRVMLGKIDQHYGEIRQLFAKLRPVSAAWRELQGPGFFNYCVKSALAPGAAIPTHVNGVSRQQLFDGLMPLFLRHASPELKNDLERYRDWARAVLLEVANLDEVPAAAARAWSAE